ncbi:MAG: hypothetical protein A2504_07810 [Bdellovibrionales bacterium RIFOXYD12_FULL_39_22]|nr:MAG: hypothetical protein A2385_11135 [Bdellovibrionales bacterium RIFOXYB1_FULL_39_21]OFZ41265.1 MAG: hypothetical protein A2485_00550 [Bdellovibrionales bacterium RIFOXYC12_FULL_39_17]OFZ45085.1 MAG: hypothetical protein A2404_11430 [Bdellovibrionales bacterium RIFOXYC1_FULL_39_130]OFZ74469.1 MAG: hypothetical protein A2560_11465 [Bdellovibrionales bacterium RIFOXYD1_FULL_39_84]OFZ92481.1 MAG: hypothetical protein A2504_07810 [Bdellovibrionales bacterium RIFOXYD12_FULL_39_22]HLE12455.1 ma
MKLTFIFLMLFFSINLYAFTLNNSFEAKFEEDEVVVNVADNTCENIGYTNQDILDMLDDALNDYWNSVPTSSLRLKKGNLVRVDDAFHDESLCLDNPITASCQSINPNLKVSKNILIACNGNTTFFTNPGILGTTIISSYSVSKNRIYGALFLVNDIVGSAVKNQERADMVAYLAHEIGHAIGLGHSPVKDSLMYYSTVERRKSLGYDDIDGVTYLYPIEQPFACGSLSFNSQEKNKNGNSEILSLALGVLAILIVGKLKLSLKQPIGPK